MSENETAGRMAAARYQKQFAKAFDVLMRAVDDAGRAEHLNQNEARNLTARLVEFHGRWRAHVPGDWPRVGGVKR